jgi:hypothetical protein
MKKEKSSQPDPQAETVECVNQVSEGAKAKRHENQKESSKRDI